MQSAFESELAELIVSTLRLKREPKSIDPEELLFEGGLGLDSIDALELGLVIYQDFGYKFESKSPEVTKIFSTLRSLAAAIELHRTK